jgi:hypothetical protein
LIGSSVAEKNPSKVVVVKFGPSVPGTFDADPVAKDFKAGKVGFVSVVTFEGSLLGRCVNEAVVEVDAMPEGIRPIFSGEA